MEVIQVGFYFPEALLWFKKLERVLLHVSDQSCPRDGGIVVAC